ncbi:hypothetical protein DOY81_007792 [Sarcophaga bullata]|nr:hypothetical protein DOY81_007792 [Sarcophaga bullata]
MRQDNSIVIRQVRVRIHHLSCGDKKHFAETHPRQLVFKL